MVSVRGHKTSGNFQHLIIYGAEREDTVEEEKRKGRGVTYPVFIRNGI